VAGTSVRIADSGEVELAGELIFDRYWNNEEATAEAVRDGWFATGDLGSLDADGYLTITGRAKEIIVTAGGKNVSPGQIEDAIRAHRLVGHAVLIGEARKFVSALITVDEVELENWAAENDPRAARRDPGRRGRCQSAGLTRRGRQEVRRTAPRLH
jgi:long-chain acyl-CoA synthetase